MNLASLNQASGILTYRGVTMETKEGITIEGDLSTFDIAVDGISSAFDERVIENGLTVKFTPAGVWGNYAALFPYLTLAEGQFVLPVVPSAINTSTDVITANAHPFLVGDRVLIGTKAGGTLPQVSSADVSEDTFYYVGTVTTNTFKLYATRANAVAETSAINFTGAGTYVRIVAQWDLVLNTVDGRQVIFHAAALESQPDLDLQAEETPFGEVTFKIYLRSRYKSETAESLYTESEVTFPGWTASSSDIKTQSQFVAWATQIPVTSVALSTEVLTSAAHGLTTGDKVYPGTTGTFPTTSPALDTETPLWVNVASSSTFTLHSTAAAASAGTGAVAFSAAGSGVLFLTVDNPPFTIQDTEAGVQVTSDVSLEDRKSDRSGIYNKQFMGCRLETKLIPLTVAGSQVLTALKLQGSGAARGRSLNASSKSLSIFSSGMFVRVNGAALKTGVTEQSMGNTEARELTFVNTRLVTSGVKVAPGYIGTSISGSATTYA
jgi:hypothetical protein